MQSMTKSMLNTWSFPRTLKSEADYDTALEQMAAFMQIEEVSLSEEQRDVMNVTGLLIEEYEKQHYTIGPPHPLEAIRYEVERKEISEAELAKLLGSRSKKSEVLSGKRKLSLAMIRRLHQVLGISADTLIQAY